MSIEKPSVLVPSQIPTYVKSYGDSLEQFLKFYYEWSEQEGFPTHDIRKLLEYQNINQTPDKFIDFFKQEFMSVIPENALADKRLLIKNIIKFYQSRGTERSYKFLFNLIFKDSVSIKYPKDTLFYTSAAKWNREGSVFVYSEAALDLDDIKSVQLRSGQILVGVDIQSARAVSEDVYELFFVINDDIPSQIDSVIINQETFQIVKNTGSFIIEKAGAGFSPGQVFQVDTIYGKGCIIKVTSVNSLGGIKTLEISRFGILDTDLITNSVNADITESSLILDFVNDFFVSQDPANLQGVSNVKLFYVELNKEEYLDNNNPISGYFYDELTLDSLGLTPTNNTSLTVWPSTIANYRGYHSDIKGFTSDQSKLLDSDINQEFSYIIESNKEFDEYADLIKETVHRAGLRFAGEKIFESIVSIKFRVENLLSILRIILNDEVQTIDQIDFFDIIKVIDDEPIATEFLFYDLSKPLEDQTPLPTDEALKHFFKVLVNEASASDFSYNDISKVLEHPSIATDFSYNDFTKSLENEAQGSDFSYNDFTKVLENQADSSDFSYNDFTKVLENQADSSDFSYNDIDKQLANTANSSDFTSIDVSTVQEDSIPIPTETQILSFFKVLKDSVEAIDNQPTFSIGYEIDPNTAAASDLTSISLSRPVEDSATSSDNATIMTDKSFSDSTEQTNYALITRTPYYVEELDENGINNRYWEPGYLDGEVVSTL